MSEDSVFVTHSFMFMYLQNSIGRVCFQDLGSFLPPCICSCSVTLVPPPTFHPDKVIENMCWVVFLSTFVSNCSVFGTFQAIGQLSSLFAFSKRHTK